MLPKFFAPSTASAQPQLVEATRQVILRTRPEGIAAALRGMAERPDTTPRLKEIDIPALVICGQHDAISPPTEMRQIAESLPRATFVEIADAGHMAPLEQPAAVNAAIRGFLTS
jgi:pimeloyl-ACP methyl ester carboxylesterase